MRLLTARTVACALVTVVWLSASSLPAREAPPAVQDKPSNTPEPASAATAKNPNAGRPKPANGVATPQELAPHFVPRPRLPAPEPVMPSADLALAATGKRDHAGPAYTLATSVASRACLGDTGLIQMVADPRGDRLYAILHDQSKVFVFDPADMVLKEEIVVPRQPVSIWCDDQRLIVACDESRLILFIDTQTLKPIKAVRIPDQPALLPKRVVGRTPDGSAITLWASLSRFDSRTSLYLIGENGETLRVLTAFIDWCAFPDKSHLWLQRGFGGSPSGVSELISFIDPQETEAFRRNHFGRQGFGLHKSFGHCFLTEDAQRFIVPTEARDLVDGAWGHDTRTLVAKADLSGILMEMDGTVICEYPAADCYVAWQDGASPEHTSDGPVIMYHNRSSGQMVRKILVKNFKVNPVIFSERQANPDLVFVPGQELLVVQEPQAPTADITVIRCGPIVPGADIPADPSQRVKNPPPKLALVGKPMIYTPSFTRPDGAKAIVFRLKKAVSGMEIDSSTGKVSFTATDANLGSFDISIVADIDGVEVPVIRWVLEIDSP